MTTANKKNGFDLIVIGAGINGAGIARDAAGRGLSVLVVEQDDIAAATSQWSTKLIHGGLRYLEYYEFRLVRESLSEREVVLHQAPHLVQPLQFVLPHEPHLRPAWMMRIGLFMYDHFSPPRHAAGVVRCRSFDDEVGRGAAAATFARASCTRTHASTTRGSSSPTRCRRARSAPTSAFARASPARAARRRRTASAGGRRSSTATAGGPSEVTAQGDRQRRPARGSRSCATPSARHRRRENVRHVKGSHIVVPRVHAEDHAYILQNADKRIVFVIPFADRYSLIGTTDVPVEEFEHPEISDAEVEYLLQLANTYLAKPLAKSDVVWTFSGIRPLYDDGQSDPSAITRDYVLKQDGGEARRAAAVGLRRQDHDVSQARRARARPIAPVTAGDGACVDAATTTLPGGDLPAAGSPRGSPRCSAATRAFRPISSAASRAATARSRRRCWATRRRSADLGEDFGNGLTAREVEYFVREEWARSADDVLWRRSKCGLGMTRRASRARSPRASRERSRLPREGATRTACCSRSPRCRTRCGARVRGVLLDIDDTLTTHGRLTVDAYAALERLRAAGKLVIPVTGRPAGWCDHIARMWPVDAVVGENGAFYMRYDRDARRLVKRFVVDEAERAAQRERARRHRRADRRGGARLRARVGPALSRGRPRDRFPRGRAASFRRPRSTASSR